VKDNSKGKRVFDVLLQNSMAYQGLDIYETVGPNKALQLEFPTIVKDGQVTISLRPEKLNNGRFINGQYPKISAIEIEEIKELYQWDNYGRSGLTLIIMNALEETWNGVFNNAVKSWSAGALGAGDRPLELLKIEIAPDPECIAVPGRIKVCNGDYGDTKWVGLNTVTLQDGFIKNSVARMNDFYLSRSSLDQQNYAMCHEMGKFYALSCNATHHMVMELIT